MKAIIEINLDNAAFEGSENIDLELSRIFSELSERQNLLSHKLSSPLRIKDINGNNVGFFCIDCKPSEE